MFGIGWSEIFLIMVVAILLIDKKDIPSIANSFKLVVKFLNSLKKEVFQAFDSIENSVEIEKIKKEIDFNFTDFSKEFIEPKDTKQLYAKKSKKNAKK